MDTYHFAPGEIATWLGERVRMEDACFANFQAWLVRWPKLRPQDEAAAKLQQLIQEDILRVLWHRFRGDPLPGPCLSGSDFLGFFPEAFLRYVPERVAKLFEEDRLSFANTLAGIVTDFDRTGGQFVIEANSYFDMWRWLAAVLSASAHQSVPPLAFLEHADAYEHIVRHAFTEPEFRKGRRATLESTLRFVRFDQLIFTPLIEVLSLGKAEARQRLRTDLQTRILPHFAELLEHIRAAGLAWVEEEARRIYGAAA